VIPWEEIDQAKVPGHEGDVAETIRKRRKAQDLACRKTLIELYSNLDKPERIATKNEIGG